MLTRTFMDKTKITDESDGIEFEKSHEGKAHKVETILRTQEDRNDIWVLPFKQYSDGDDYKLAIKVLDAQDVKNPISDTDLVKKSKEICTDVYEQDVYVKSFGLSVMPEGDDLKYVMDKLLELRYGHSLYSVEYNLLDDIDADSADEDCIDAAKLLSRNSVVLIEVSCDDWMLDLNPDDDEDSNPRHKDPNDHKVPQEVWDFILKTSSELRSDLCFQLFEEDTSLARDKKPVFAKGFAPVEAIPA